VIVEIAKEADGVLNQWADATRSGNRTTLDFKISGIYTSRWPLPGRLKLDDSILDEVDHIVGALQDPMRQVIRRYYLDEIPGKRYLYYKKDIRTIEMKARTESIGIGAFKDYLRIGRYIVHQKMVDLDLI